MSKKQYVLLLAVALVFWTAAVSKVSAETTEERQIVEKAEEDARETLRGLKGVQVVVEDMDPDVERDGLTKSQLQTDVELRLRKAGIQVLKEEERRATPGRPYLYVAVTTLKDRDGLSYAFAINVDLEQKVALLTVA